MISLSKLFDGTQIFMMDDEIIINHKVPSF